MGLLSAINPYVPNKIRVLWRNWRSFINGIKPLYPRSCPLCGYEGYFSHFGRPPRLDARCPKCSSLERHRLFWLWLKEDEGRLAEPILHFAAETQIERKLRGLYKQYSTADLFNASADLKLDIEKIDLQDESIGTILCNHVLEHVDDATALGQLNRVLRKDGLLIVSVPIVEGWSSTYENEDVKDPGLRDLHFGQHDHVRYYGSDFRQRLTAAGFNFEEITADGAAVIEHGLLRGEKFFLCRK